MNGMWRFMSSTNFLAAMAHIGWACWHRAIRLPLGLSVADGLDLYGMLGSTQGVRVRPCFMG